MRVTTNAILRNYKSNLATSVNNLNTARNSVMTGRKFTRAAENPADALRAAQLERKYIRNNDYIENVKDAQSRQDSQESAAYQINKIAAQLSKEYGLEALNGTNQSAEIRGTYAQAWREAQANMLKSLNATYGDSYIFAGADGEKQPFELKEGKDGKQILTYQGIDVCSTDPKDQEKLKKLSKEAVYIDLGFGMEADGMISDANAFNTALPGINLVGYGMDEEGNSRNMIVLAGQIADELEKEPFDKERFEELLNGFDKGRDSLLNELTSIGTKSDFLETTQTRLEENKLNLEIQLDQVVNADPAEAITQFAWAQYAYNAALKVGTNILTPSFIDFMK